MPLRPALELAELLRSGQVHARELVEAALVRLEEREGSINAFCFVNAERTLVQAAAITPDDPRPFAGVPIAIKDGTPQESLPMRIGSTLFEDHVADHDSASVRRLGEAGFVAVGRTTMPEFGILPTTEPRPTGPTRNPWDTSRTPGGSPGGSAAALCAGVVPWPTVATEAVHSAYPPPAAASSGSRPREAVSRWTRIAATAHW